MEEGDDIFTDQSDFGGSLLRVTAVPYAHHVQAHAIPPDREDWGDGNQGCNSIDIWSLRL